MTINYSEHDKHKIKILFNMTNFQQFIYLLVHYIKFRVYVSMCSIYGSVLGRVL